MRRALVTVALVAALVVEFAYTAPAHATAGLRAISCCARRCARSGALCDAMRCCGGTVGDELATTAGRGKEPSPPVPAHVARADTSVVRGLHARFSADLSPRRERAAPLFLLVRSLRL